MILNMSINIHFRSTSGDTSFEKLLLHQKCHLEISRRFVYESPMEIFGKCFETPFEVSHATCQLVQFSTKISFLKNAYFVKNYWRMKMLDLWCLRNLNDLIMAFDLDELYISGVVQLWPLELTDVKNGICEIQFYDES